MMLADAELQAETDRLYGLPLDEFVGQRDALAKRLRGAGDRDAATVVKALRKPTAGAWALNQAVRRRHTETEALLAAGERLRSAHSALLSGGDRAELRAAMADQRALAATLADCAEAIASETGKSGPALKERVRSTLHAAALDDEVRELLAGGRLVREREAVGLGGFGAAEEAPQPPRPRDGSADRREAARRGEAQRLLAEAQTAEERSEADLKEASALVEKLRGELKEAESAQREAARLLRGREGDRAKRGRELRRLQK